MEAESLNGRGSIGGENHELQLKWELHGRPAAKFAALVAPLMLVKGAQDRLASAFPCDNLSTLRGNPQRAKGIRDGREESKAKLKLEKEKTCADVDKNETRPGAYWAGVVDGSSSIDVCKDSSIRVQFASQDRALLDALVNDFQYGSVLRQNTSSSYTHVLEIRGDAAEDFVGRVVPKCVAKSPYAEIIKDVRSQKPAAHRLGRGRCL